MLNRLLIGAAALALAAAPAAVLAQDETTMGEVVVHASPYDPDVEVKRQVVRFADLDLTEPWGAETLMTRIKAAARNVCSPMPTRELYQLPQYNQCMHDAIDGAVAQADSPLLDDLWNGREVAYNY
jgi:UrcA family protein